MSDYAEAEHAPTDAAVDAAEPTGQATTNDFTALLNEYDERSKSAQDILQSDGAKDVAGDQAAYN